jgi:hypothetical protein
MCRERLGFLSIVLVVVTGACHDDGSAPARTDATEPVTGREALAAAAAPAQPEAGQGVSGHHRAVAGETWVPAEYKTGMAKFKDPYVYVDGVPTGILKFAELPLTLHPVWHEERASVDWVQGDPWPDHIMVRQRRYRFYDYLKALGVEVGRIREIHLYGGGRANRAAAVISGAELRGHRDDFVFRFGSEIAGKPIPACPDVRWNCADNITSVAVYVNKQPPKQVDGELYLNGELMREIPYFGEPLRGGVRIFIDGHYATRIKRRMLEGDDLKTADKDGELGWKLFAFLEKQGLDTRGIQEAWLVAGGKLVEHVTQAELAFATFRADPQGKGEILFGREATPTTAIHLYTRVIDPNQLPVILPHEARVLD